jgi:hypothetical protein
MFWFSLLLFIVCIVKSALIVKKTILEIKTNSAKKKKEERRVMGLLAKEGVRPENLISGLTIKILKKTTKVDHIIRGVDRIWIMDCNNTSAKIQFTTGDLKIKTKQGFLKLSCLKDVFQKAKFLNKSLDVPVVAYILETGNPIWESKSPDNFIFEHPVAGRKTLSNFGQMILTPSQKPVSGIQLDRAWKKLKNWENQEQHKIVYLTKTALNYAKPAQYWVGGGILCLTAIFWQHHHPDGINDLMLRMGLAGDRSILEIIKGTPKP